MFKQSLRIFLPLKSSFYNHVTKLFQISRMSSQFSHKKLFKRSPTGWQVRALVSSEISETGHFDEIEPNMSEMDEIIDHNIENIRECLYPKSEVNAIKDLNEVKNLDELKEVLMKLSEEELKEPQIMCQTILVIWDIVRQILLAHLGSEDILLIKKEEMEKHSSEFLSTEIVQKIFQNLETQVTNLSLDELSCCLMYLNKIGISIRDPFLQSFVSTFLDKLSTDEVTFTSISRFVVALYNESGLYPLYTCLDVLPFIYNHLEKAETSDELRLVTIALNHVARLVTEDKLKIYQRRVEEFLENGILNESTVRTNLKIINFLNYPEWSSQNQNLSCKVVLLMKPAIDSLPIKEIFLIQKHIKTRLEPALIVPSIVQRADVLLETVKSAELLTCSLFETIPSKRKRLSMMADELISVSGDATLPSLFKVLRLLKTADTKLYDAYWDKVVEDIKSDQTGMKIIRHMHRYMHFNNNLGGTYRHKNLEKIVMSLLFNEIDTGITALLPSAFARAVSFIIAYGSHLLREEVMPDIIIDRIEAMSSQFGVYDCLRISRGIQIAHELRYKFYIPTKEAPHLLRIEEVLNNAVLRQSKNPSIIDLNLIIKAYNARKSSRKTALFQKLIAQYDTFDGELSSRIIRDIGYNLVTSNYFCPNIFKKFIKYANESSDYISGETLEKIITSFFALGYVPEDQEFFKTCAKIIERDFNYMSGLSIIQSCLALTYFKALPEHLIEKVFNINFIRRLEEEIESCYSKETYPERVLNNVMQLNRAVCLDVPEANIPWFQQNYIEAQMSKIPNIESKFMADVKNLFLSILPDKAMLKVNHVTPYGYKIEFVLHSSNGKIVPLSNNPPANVHKLAIIPLRVESCCENSPNVIKGFELLKKRHLEILGYKVIHINFRDWHSMYMSVPGARVQFIKNLLGIS